MSLTILFGFPGAGKTFVGNVFQSAFSYHFYEGDTDIPREMKAALDQKLPITGEMRDAFFTQLLSSVERLKQIHPNLVVAQTFIKEKYRQLFWQKFPEAQFIFVQARDETRKLRLERRSEYPLDWEYAQKMVAQFDMPSSSIITINNDLDGAEEIKKQLKKII